MNTLTKNIVFGVGLLATTSLPEGILAQTTRGRIRVVETLDTPTVAPVHTLSAKKLIQPVKRSSEVNRSIQRSITSLDSIVSSLKNWDTVNHVVGENICFFWKEDGWQNTLIVNIATPRSHTYPAENLLYVFDFVRTKTDEKGNVIYSSKREKTYQGISRKILIETIDTELYAYYKDYDNSKPVDVATPLSESKVMRSDAPDLFVPEDAKKGYAYRKIGSKKLAFEVDNIRMLIEQARRSYLAYIHSGKSRENIK